MSIITKGSQIDYLLNYRNGKIKEGLKIDSPFDEFFRLKKGELNLILGHDNVGKSYWIFYYFLNLALKHNLKFCVYAGENKAGQILRDLVQMYAGQRFKTLSEQQIVRYSSYLEQYFDFIDNKRLYKPNELLEIFESSDADVFLIDPFTALNREMSYESNYRFLNDARAFCNKHEKTIFINTHPNTESGRAGYLYPDKHHFAGHLRPPMKSSVEGGKSFCNRVDSILILHRLISHETMRFFTMVNIEKIKDVETGGRPTLKDFPVLFEFNNGLGFLCENVDSLKNHRPKQPKQKTIEL